MEQTQKRVYDCNHIFIFILLRNYIVMELGWGTHKMQRLGGWPELILICNVND